MRECVACVSETLFTEFLGNFLAGAVGFEPTNAGSKSRCLAERRVSIVSLLRFIIFNWEKITLQV